MKRNPMEMLDAATVGTRFEIQKRREEKKMKARFQIFYAKIYMQIEQNENFRRFSISNCRCFCKKNIDFFHFSILVFIILRIDLNLLAKI